MNTGEHRENRENREHNKQLNTGTCKHKYRRIQINTVNNERTFVNRSK